MVDLGEKVIAALLFFAFKTYAERPWKSTDRQFIDLLLRLSELCDKLIVKKLPWSSISI
jgi:hypothetical protein